MTVLRILLAQRGPKLHEFRGQYLTARQIAEITGVKLRTVHRRIQYGLPIDEPARYGPEPRRYLFRGRHLTVPEIAAELGCSVATVRRRVSGDRVLEPGEITPPLDEPRPIERRIRFRGITRTATAWAEITGIPSHLIRDRLDRGWTIARALTTPVAFKRKTVIRRMSTAFRRARNAAVVARMVASFASTSHASPTGGLSRTFGHEPGTGGGSFAQEIR